MKSKTIGGSKLSLLMACASPGSALAYHLGLVTNHAGLMQRSMVPVEQPATMSAGPAGPMASVVSWLRGLPAAMGRWNAERERKELDRHLAQAQNVSDLEARMRDLHSGRYWLP